MSFCLCLSALVQLNVFSVTDAGQLGPPQDALSQHPTMCSCGQRLVRCHRWTIHFSRCTLWRFDRPLPITRIENDNATIVVHNGNFDPVTETLSTGGYLLREGSSRTLGVRLSAQPLAATMVSVTLRQTTDRVVISQMTRTLLFASAAWNVTQLVSLSAPTSAASSGSMTTFTLQLSSVSVDMQHNGMSSAVQILLMDNTFAPSQLVACSQPVAHTSENGDYTSFFVASVKVQTVPVTVQVTSTNLLRRCGNPDAGDFAVTCHRRRS